MAVPRPDPGAGVFTTHRPQLHFLALLATGDGQAIASRGRFGAEGAWACRWKEGIDGRFLDQFRVSQPVHRAAHRLNPVSDVSAPRSKESR